MASCNRVIALSLVVIVLLTAIVTQGRYPMKVTAQGELEDKSMTKEISKVNSIYQGKEYSTLTPFFMKDGQKTIQLGFPKLPDNVQPEMTIEEGQTITMNFESKPIQVDAFLTDYDADVPVRYPLEETTKNTFRVTPHGIKTLEVQAQFPGNEQVSYSTLVDVVKIS
jgi:NhaP-type Na+/H+ and K+/H+ antiporter